MNDIEKELIELGFVMIKQSPPFSSRETLTYLKFRDEPIDILFYWGKFGLGGSGWKLRHDRNGFHYLKDGGWRSCDYMSLSSFILLYGNM